MQSIPEMTSLVRLSLLFASLVNFSGVFSLKLRQKSITQELNLSPCLKKLVSHIQKQLSGPSQFTLQATCHAYSGVNIPTPTSQPMRVMQCKGFYLDEATKMASVEPGVRYVDVYPLMRQKHIFLTHGNYAGQTIIGLLATGTHGAGTLSPHNYIVALTVVNGVGLVKRVSQADSEFPAWQNSMGVLGVVVKAELALLEEFHVETTNYDTGDVYTSLSGMVDDVLVKGKPFSWLNCLNITATGSAAICMNAARRKTQKPLTPPFDKEDGTGCCPDMPTDGFSAVISSVDGDLYVGKDVEPAEAEPINCVAGGELLKVHRAAIGKIFGMGVDWREVGYEIQLGDFDMPKAYSLLPTFLVKVNSVNSATFSKLRTHLRHSPMDIRPPLLSPTKYSSMFQWEWYLMDLGDQTQQETDNFLASYKWFCDALRLSGANFRFHLGKGGVGNFILNQKTGDKNLYPATPLWDMHSFYFWKKQNDPKNRFTNEKWEAYRTIYGLV